MSAGVPGLGLSGLFTLLSALVLPLNRRKAPSPIGRLVALAVAIGVVLVLTSDAATDVVTQVRHHITGAHGQRFAGIVMGPAIWGAPVVLISAVIMVVVLAAGEALLHLVGTTPTPTPPPITAGARPAPRPSEIPDAPGGA